MLTFQEPYFLLGVPLTLLAALVLAEKVNKREAYKTIKLANFKLIEDLAQPIDKWTKALPACQILALCFLWIALSQPAWSYQHLVKSAQVILAIDISKSMAADDFQPNRLTAAKEAALEFVHLLPKDVELGLLLFDGQSRILVPLSIKHNSVENALESISLKSIGRGTAIGEAIISAEKEFNNKGQHKSGNRHLILLTDGENNAGADPIEAINRVDNVTIYTVGIGSPFGGMVNGGLQTTLDSALLRQISQSTGGEYFETWQGNTQLREIYKALSQNYHQANINTSLSGIFTLLSLFLCSFSFIFQWTRLNGFP